MKPIEIEIERIKEQHSQMWEMVEQQVRKAFVAMETFDKELAHEIISREKMVNAQELVVDHYCENFIALFNPVAVDLRLMISLLKINNNLERIGDFAESIALFVLHQQTKVMDPELVKNIQLKKMTDNAMQMLSIARNAWDQENCTMASRVLTLDDILDDINRDSVKILADYSVAHPEHATEILHIYAVIRRIERIGDRASNIAEDTCFYLDAKELRHRNKS
ncbi:MAG: phosphate signaling complex protein PhoU [Bacteroidales bacterium]